MYSIKLKMKNYILLMIFFISSLSIQFGLGYFHEIDYSNIFIFAAFFFCYLLSTKNNISLYIAVILFSTLSIYFPTGITYGILNADLLAPLFFTNKSEIFGYILAMKFEIAFSLLFCILQILLLFLAKKERNFK